MEIDKTTLQDLMVIQHEDEFSIFGKLNETLTVRGKEQFLKNLMHPFSDAAAIIEVQQVLKLILKNQAGWTPFGACAVPAKKGNDVTQRPL